MKQASLYLKALIESNSTITTACGSRIYPIAAPAGVNDFPFVTFEHQSRPGDGTKDGNKRVIDAAISVVSRTALEAEELSDSFLPAMYSYCESESNTFSGTFYDPDFSKEEELYVAEIDAFIVRLNITFETK